MIQTERAQIVESPDLRPQSRPQTPIQRGSVRGARAQAVGTVRALPPAVAHVLIAEDDRAMRRFLVECFEERGYVVTEAENGDELRRRISALGRSPGSSAPDILVSDIRLPGSTGLELLADLRRSDWALPVILITAFGNEAVHREGKRLGAAMVLDKPFDAEDLLDAVKSLVPF